MMILCLSFLQTTPLSSRQVGRSEGGILAIYIAKVDGHSVILTFQQQSNPSHTPNIRLSSYLLIKNSVVFSPEK